MYRIVPWDPTLDLTYFYKIAGQKGFVNNSSQRMLVDSFNIEREKQVWILYYNDVAIGSVAAHSFDTVMEQNSYRIAVRTCVFTDHLPNQSLRTKSVITDHQNVTAQFLIPTCIKWTGTDKNLYITSNESTVGSQRRVHRTFFPLLEKKGIVKKIKDIEYRGALQTVWQLFPVKFLEDLELYTKWQ